MTWTCYLYRLLHLLSVHSGIIRDVDFEQHLQDLEAAAAADPEWPATTGAERRHAATH